MPRKPGDTSNSDGEFDGDEFEDDEFESNARADCCTICESSAGECDHLVVSIDRTFSEIVAGALFAHERDIRVILEGLVSLGPELLQDIGAGPALEQVADSVASDIAEGLESGDALANNYPRLLGALSYMLQDDGDVSVSESDIDDVPGQTSSFENLWADEPEGVVERLIERLHALVEDAE